MNGRCQILDEICCMCLWGFDISCLLLLKVHAILNFICVDEELKYFCISCLTLNFPCHSNLVDKSLGQTTTTKHVTFFFFFQTYGGGITRVCFFCGDRQVNWDIMLSFVFQMHKSLWRSVWFGQKKFFLYNL